MIGWLSSAFAILTIGAYPTFPPAGPLKGKSAEEQAAILHAMGINLAGGKFTDAAIPTALRKAGIRTYGLVVLFQGEQHWKSHPESRPVTAAGLPLPKDRWYAGVCPNQDWLRQEKLQEIESMLASGWYDVINLDFIRYPVHWEVPEPKIHDTCYCPVCLRKFSADTGITLPNSGNPAAWIAVHHDARWRRWRADQITAFCLDVKRLRDRIRPQTLLTLAAVPWQPSDYNNAIYRIIGQDFQALAGAIDVFQPMSYHVLNGRPVAWVGVVNRYLARETGKPVWPFVIFDPDRPLNTAGWTQLLGEALTGGASGLLAFPFPKMTSPGLDVFRAKFGPVPAR